MDPIWHLMILSGLAVVLFSVCCVQWMKSVLQPIPLDRKSRYSRSALRVARGYKIFSWGVLSLTFLGALVIAFMDVFSRI